MEDNTNPLKKYYRGATSVPPTQDTSPKMDGGTGVNIAPVPETQPPKNPLEKYYNSNQTPAPEARPDTAFLGSPEERQQIQEQMHAPLPMEQLASKIGNLPADAIKAIFPQGPVFQGDLRNITPIGAFVNLAKQTGGFRHPSKEAPATFSANDAAGVLANAAVPVIGSKLLGTAAEGIGNWAQERPYAQLNEISRQKGGMPVDQLFKEEGIIPEDYKEMTTQASNLQSSQYPSAMSKIANKIKSSGIQMEPPESALEQLQNKVNEWKKSKTKVDAANVLQQDLDETVKKLQGGDFTNYGDVKSAVSGELKEKNFGLLKDNSSIATQYGKMKGEALRFARANAAEAAEPGLGQEVFDTGNKQQTLMNVGKKIGQKAVAESQSPTIGGIPRFLEKRFLERPGPMISGGRQAVSIGQTLQSPWDYLVGKTNEGQ